MEIKARPNHQLYIDVLRKMTPGQRWAKAMELSDTAKRLFRYGLRKRFQDVDEAAFHRIYLEHLAKWHNRNY